MPKTQRTPEQLEMIRRNLHGGVKASKGGEAAFDKWFHETFPDTSTTPEDPKSPSPPSTAQVHPGS
jgi:hypothetical protein